MQGLEKDVKMYATYYNLLTIQVPWIRSHHPLVVRHTGFPDCILLNKYYLTFTSLSWYGLWIYSPVRLNSKSFCMKKYLTPSESASKTPPDLIDDKIFKELQIVERTQVPPSEELIAKLNHLASLPPFCYTQKSKKHETR